MLKPFRCKIGTAFFMFFSSKGNQFSKAYVSTKILIKTSSKNQRHDKKREDF